MKEPKFKIGQKLWSIDGVRCAESAVTGIFVDIDTVYYNTGFLTNHGWSPELYFFESKEALKNSL